MHLFLSRKKGRLEHLALRSYHRSTECRMDGWFRERFVLLFLVGLIRCVLSSFVCLLQLSKVGNCLRCGNLYFSY